VKTASITEQLLKRRIKTKTLLDYLIPHSELVTVNTAGSIGAIKFYQDEPFPFKHRIYLAAPFSLPQPLPILPPPLPPRSRSHDSDHPCQQPSDFPTGRGRKLWTYHECRLFDQAVGLYGPDDLKRIQLAVKTRTLK
jgi:hypothetical protein